MEEFNIDDGELVDTVETAKVENGILMGEWLGDETEIDLINDDYILYPTFATSAGEDQVIEIYRVNDD